MKFHRGVCAHVFYVDLPQVQAIRTPTVMRVSERGPIAVWFQGLGAYYVKDVVELPSERSAVWGKGIQVNIRPGIRWLSVRVGAHDKRYPSRPPDVHHTSGEMTVSNIYVNRYLGKLLLGRWPKGSSGIASGGANGGAWPYAGDG